MVILSIREKNEPDFRTATFHETTYVRTYIYLLVDKLIQANLLTPRKQRFSPFIRPSSFVAPDLPD